MEQTASRREEIERHIQEADQWYHRYDEIISGLIPFADRRARHLALIQAALRWEAEETWLYYAGVKRAELEYDEEAQTHRLPEGWTPSESIKP